MPLQDANPTPSFGGFGVTREAEIEHDDGQQEQQLGVACQILLPTSYHSVLSMP